MSVSKPHPSPTLSPLSSPKALLARLTKLTSTLPGLDATLMLAQYSSPIIITLLLALARFRSKYPRLGAAGGTLRLAEGWGKAAMSIGDARVIMRSLGLLPVIQGFLTLHPNPLNFTLSGPKALPTLQLISLMCYYPLEHIAWLNNKGILAMTPSRAGKAMLWSVRFWALYVLLEIYKLRNTYFSLLSRTKALRAAKAKVTPAEAEGYELQSTSEASSAKEVQVAEVVAIKQDWAVWKNAVLINSGYAPLTIHWSTPGGLWKTPLWTAVFGTMAATGQFMKQWANAA